MTNDCILVCDPSSQTQRALRVTLRQAGYTVLITGTGFDALESAARDRPRAAILEVELPDINGIEVCRRLRRRSQLPILMLSAIDDDEAKIAALKSGADDYVTKPFSPGELVARLAVRLRVTPSPLRIEDDGLMIDLAAHLVTRDDEAVHLTATEFAVLRVLVTSVGTVTYRTLAREVWGLRGGDAAPRVRVHVANLRAKLDRGDRSSVISTEVGIGYRFRRHGAAARDGSGPDIGDPQLGL